MDTKTKQIFAAPWTILSDGEIFFEVRDKDDNTICDKILLFENAKRIVLLPNLFDGLLFVLFSNCCKCPHWNKNILLTHSFENGCQFKDGYCDLSQYWRLLRDVRDGK